MSTYRVISNDSHINEPRDLWSARAESAFKDRLPKVVNAEDGSLDPQGRPVGDSWIVDGKRYAGFGGDPKTGVRFEDPSQLLGAHFGPRTFEESQVEEEREERLGGYFPDEHVKDNDIDGVDVSVIYPTLGVFLFGVPDGPLFDSICRIYNDWIADWCSAHPDRLKAVAMINHDDVSVAVKEMERCRKMGLLGAMITVYPRTGQLYDQEIYEPLWAASQDLDMPLSLHASTNRAGFYAGPEDERAAYITCLYHWAELSLADIIFSGAFDRYPKLRVGSVEHELAWVPHFLDRMDYTYTQRIGQWLVEGRLSGDALPSEVFRTNCFLGFQEDAMGIQMRDLIGVDTMQFGSDYPHQESTWPRSREILEGMLIGCTEEEKAKIAGGNCAKMYNL